MSINIIFMGTPDFAVPCLDALITSEHNVVGVFSQPDRPQGRGYKLVPTPVKALAVAHNIPVYQPEKLRQQDQVTLIEELKPDLIVVVAYGQILPKAILDIPPLGCINVHGSLLPRLRGAAPFQWSVLNGDKVTGITTMYMGVGMDTGDMILKKETPIGDTETAGQLFDRLAPMGSALLMETIPMLISGTAPRIPQDDSLATHAPMIKKQMAKLDFSKSALEVSNWVRGMSPWPTAFCFLGDTQIAVHEARVVDSALSGKPGQLLDDKALILACGDGTIELTLVQAAGKKRVSGTDFINGSRLESGIFFK